MIENDAFEITSPCGIGTVVYILLFTAANANEAHNDIVTIRAYGVVAESDTGVGSRLSENGDVGFDIQVGLQFNDAANIEDHNAVAAANCGAKRTCARVVEVGDVNHRLATPPRDITSVTLSTRKCGSLLLSNSDDSHHGSYKCK